MVVPRNRINQMLEFTHNLQKAAGVRIKSFGHAGDGNLHAYILRDGLSDDEWKTKLNYCMGEIYRKAKELSGKVSGEHGIGYIKQPYLADSATPGEIELMRGIKKTFDPKNILNPGKIL